MPTSAGQTRFRAVPISLIACLASYAQVASPGPTTSRSPAEVHLRFSVSISMPKVHLSVGEYTKAVVLMTNPDSIAEIPCGSTVQVHVVGKNGEPPITEWSHRYGVLLPGGSLDLSAASMCVSHFLQPGLDIYMMYDLSRYFDLREPGTYTVFFEIQDPSGSRLNPVLLRTNTVQFDVQAPAEPTKTPPGVK